MDARAHELIQLENDLLVAIKEQHLNLYYQPQVDLDQWNDFSRDQAAAVFLGSGAVLFETDQNLHLDTEAYAADRRQLLQNPAPEAQSDAGYA